MSFINSFKRALGFPDEFGTDDDDELDDDLDLVDDPDPTLDDISAADSELVKLTEGNDSAPIASDEEILAISNGFFDSVLNYFNGHQPELVQKCIDLDAQRRLIVANLEKELKERIATLADNACRRGESKWAEQQQRMGAELKKLKSDYNSVRQQREEFQSAQLSATRQKRALTDRIHDLETQVTNLEAEREQLQLENKSMVNRLRNSDPSPLQPAMQQDTNELEATKNRVSELEAELEAATQSNHLLREELQKLNESTIIDEQARELEHLEKQLTPLRELKDAAEAKVIALTKELKESDATIAALQKRLSDTALDGEKRIEQIADLRQTIESNLYSHAQIQSELRAEIEDLKQQLIAVQATSTPVAESEGANTIEKSQSKKRRKKRRKSHADFSATITGITDDEPDTAGTKISAIDELMESTDWFVAPDPVPLKKDPEVEENFGYKEPQRKNDAPADDRQMTLW